MYDVCIILSINHLLLPQSYLLNGSLNNADCQDTGHVFMAMLVFRSNTMNLHTIYTLSTHYLHTIYTVSTQYLDMCLWRCWCSGPMQWYWTNQWTDGAGRGRQHPLSWNTCHCLVPGVTRATCSHPIHRIIHPGSSSYSDFTINPPFPKSNCWIELRKIQLTLDLSFL